MPSKDYNGQNPLGGKRIQPSAGLGASGAFAQVELQVGRLQPAISLQSGSLQTPNGRIPSQKVPPAGTTVPCQLGKMLFDSENSTTLLPKFKLLPGFLTGGGGTELIEPDNLTATIDDFVWLQVAWTANGDATNIFPGGTMGTVTIVTGATIPSDTIPEAGSLSGFAHIVLGGWVSDNADEPSPVWVRQGCGSIQLYFCPGGFFFGRSNVVSQ